MRNSYKNSMCYGLWLPLFFGLLAGCSKQDIEQQRLVSFQEILTKTSKVTKHNHRIKANKIYYYALEEYTVKNRRISTKATEFIGLADQLSSQIQEIKDQVSSYITPTKSSVFTDSIFARNKATVKTYLLEGEKGKAYLLFDKLNTYLDSIQGFYPHKKLLHPITYLTKEKARHQQMEYSRIKDPVQYLFEDAEPLQALLWITQAETWMLNSQNEMLENMAKDIAISADRFSSISLMIVPQSHQVEQGEEYVADMFIGVFYGRWIGYYSYQGSDSVDNHVPFLFTGFSQKRKRIVDFPLSAGSLEGTRKEWMGAVTIFNSFGEDSTIHFTKTYTVYSTP